MFYVIIERFHCQLKVSLKAFCNPCSPLDRVASSNSTGCLHYLKAYLQCTIVELVYGTTLMLPSEVFNHHANHMLIISQLPSSMLLITAISILTGPNKASIKGRGTWKFYSEFIV